MLSNKVLGVIFDLYSLESAIARMCIEGVVGRTLFSDRILLKIAPVNLVRQVRLG